jgi:hypothetical protein
MRVRNVRSPSTRSLESSSIPASMLLTKDSSAHTRDHESTTLKSRVPRSLSYFACLKAFLDSRSVELYGLAARPYTVVFILG